MNNWNKYTLVAIMVTAAGFAYINSSRPDIPADLRDAVADSGEFNTAIPVLGKDNENMPVPKAAAAIKTSPADIAKSYLTGPADEPATPVEWVAIPGGKFMLGSNDATDPWFKNTVPAHEVAIKTFEMSKTHVTVAQYAECVIKGECTEPATTTHCNWGQAGRQLHPINCVTWDQAQQYARFKGARLPSEAEWEYAARSGGKKQKYPWGDSGPHCGKVVMKRGENGSGCGKKSTWPVCSKPDGNTEHGLCDMAGNVSQWLQDKYHVTYEGAPTDGSAFEVGSVWGVLRGGSYGDLPARYLRVDYRAGLDSDHGYAHVGFRIAR